MTTTPDRDDVMALAAGFPDPSEEQWRALVEKARVGATDGATDGATVESLNSTTYDGIAIAALATRAHADAAPAIAAMPCGGAAIRSVIAEATPAAANTTIRAEVAGGAEEIVLQIKAPGQAGIAIDSATCLETALDGIELDQIAIHLRWPPQIHAGGAANLLALYELQKIPPADRRGGLGIDPISWAATGACRLADVDDIGSSAASIINTGLEAMPGFDVFSASALPYHEAGATESQELAAMLSTGGAYLRAAETSGIDLDDAARRIGLELAADCDVFVTIAKLRAARLLWARFLEACGIDNVTASLTAQTSARMMCVADPHTNMVRTTAAALAAGAGGANAITVLPFTHPAGQPDAFARRIARNTQAILRDESLIGAVADPAAGGFAIEQLTTALAEHAWALFQEIEAEGGIACALASGSVQKRIATVRKARARDLAEGTTVLVGATTYRGDTVDLNIEPWTVPPPIEADIELVRPIRLETLGEPVR